MSKSNSKKNGSKKVSEKAAKRPVPKEVKKEPTQASASKGVGGKPAKESPPVSTHPRRSYRWPAAIIVALVGATAMIIVAIVEKVPIPIPDGTPPPTLPKECSINNLAWQPYFEGGLGSTINVTPVVQTDCEIKITFNLKTSGEVAVYKKLDENLLSQAQGIRFSFKGTGTANTLDFKLVEQDASGKEAIFFTRWCRATSTAEKEISKEITFRELTCRPTSSTDCNDGRRKVKPELVDRIDFSFSSQPDCNDTPGQGEVTIKGIQLIP